MLSPQEPSELAELIRTSRSGWNVVWRDLSHPLRTRVGSLTQPTGPAPPLITDSTPLSHLHLGGNDVVIVSVLCFQSPLPCPAEGPRQRPPYFKAPPCGGRSFLRRTARLTFAGKTHVFWTNTSQRAPEPLFLSRDDGSRSPGRLGPRVIRTVRACSGHCEQEINVIT